MNRYIFSKNHGKIDILFISIWVDKYVQTNE